MADGNDLRRLLADHDDDAAARLIAEARAEAEARVREQLADAYTDILLEQVRAELAPQPTDRRAAPEPPAAPEPEPPAPPEPELAAPPQRAAPAELAWYVYCVVSGDHDPLPDDLEGVDPRHPVGGLEQGELTAVVSRVPLDEFGEEPLREHLSDMEWLERTARRHEHVQETVARGGTPIPMRLCSIYREESGVREMLTRESDALGHALAQLHGKAEWGVKAFADADAAEPTEPADETAPGSGGGTAYMQSRLTHRRRREDATARLDAACDATHAALCAVAADAVMLSPHRPEMSGRDVPMILNASYLVVDSDADAFHAEVDRLAGELAPLGIELERTGPWPPYNFVPGTIGAAW